MIQLIQLTPDQITERWEELKPMLGYSWVKVPNPEARMQGVLNILMKGQAQLWTLEEDDELKVLAMTVEGFDLMKMSKALFFVGMHIIEQIGVKSWAEALRTLSKYAKSSDCKFIVGNTKDQKILRLMKILGASVEYQASFNTEEAIMPRKVSHKELEEVI